MAVKDMTDGAVSQAQLAAVAGQLVRAAKDQLPENLGVIVLVFDYGANRGGVAYASTADREGCVSLLAQVVAEMQVGNYGDDATREPS